MSQNVNRSRGRGITNKDTEDNRGQNVVKLDLSHFGCPDHGMGVKTLPESS